MDGRRLEPWGKSQAVCSDSFKLGKRWGGLQVTADHWVCSAPTEGRCPHMNMVSFSQYGYCLEMVSKWTSFTFTSPHLPTQDFQVTACSVWRSHAQPWLICYKSLQGQDQGRAMKLPLLLWLTLRQITSPHSNAAFNFRVADIWYIFKIKLAKRHAGS